MEEAVAHGFEGSMLASSIKGQSGHLLETDTLPTVTRPNQDARAKDAIPMKQIVIIILVD